VTKLTRAGAGLDRASSLGRSANLSVRVVASTPADVAGAAALFLAEFVDSAPWARLDVAGAMRLDADESWRSRGATGLGARPLIDLATGSVPPSS
jgi:leucyl aminopeptidase